MKRPLGALLVAGALACAADGLPAREGDFIGFIPFAVPSPQDIALDTTDGTYWVATFLQGTVYHYAADLSGPIESFEQPFGPNRFLTGIAFNSVDGTILVSDAISGKILEMDRGGIPTGGQIVPGFLDVVNPNTRPVALGLAFHAAGDGGRGSLYVVESVGTLIYELKLTGEAIRHFVHPDDPDGFPGKGATAPGNHDVALILDGDALAGFYVTGGKGKARMIRRLDPEGKYTGISIPMDDAGGTVSGLLRVPFRFPGAPAPVDAFICVIESSAQFAILEGGEPGFREILDFACETSGSDIRLGWSNPQTYDGIVILEGCQVLATLPGTATEWSHRFDRPGVRAVTLRAFAGLDSCESSPCEIVVGAGEVLATGDVTGEGGEYLIPLDLTSDGAGHILVSSTVSVGGSQKARILVFDDSLTFLEYLPVPESFSGPEDYVSGIAYGRPGGEDRIFLFNASTSTVGAFDGVGALVGTFDARLPNLEDDPEAEPDLGFVSGMTFDPAGDGAAGSLWLVETDRDRIYEIDLDGNVLRDFEHPYRSLEPPPEGSPYGTGSSGVALVPGSGSARLFLSGGALRDSGQPHILQVVKATAAPVEGSTIPTAGIRRYGSTGLLGIEAVERGGETRLVALARSGGEARLLEVRTDLPPVPKPTFLEARQETIEDAVVLRFQNNGPYDRVEVLRDCVKVADLRGDAVSFRDAAPGAGIHEYAVRGVTGGRESEPERTSLRVGVGALLGSRIVWPAISPQQMAADPVDDLFVLAGNYPRDERNLHFFGPGFEHLETREILFDPPWKVAALAIRHPPREEGEVWYLVWQQPVPLGGAGSERFFLVTESLVGQYRGAVEIFPPVPSNGFIVYPTGLAWNPRTDSFFYLERNSRTFVEIAKDGVALRTFPHPDPPFQSFVYGLGVSVAPERNTIFFTTAGRRDHTITVAREMRMDGTLTGVSIPLDGAPNTIRDIAVRGKEILAVGTYRFPELLRIKAFGEPGGLFIRGDSNADGVVGITDPIVTLAHLFQGGPEPPCLDAADADDSGTVNLTDAVLTLLVLFGGAGDLPPPYPNAGTDPTPDGLECF